MTEKSSVEIFDENYKLIMENIEKAAVKSGRNASNVILLAATKTVDAEVINHAIDSGISYIGENKVQELLSKVDKLRPVHRHLIGHLQTNKVKDIIDKVEMIQSVDSVHLAKEIEKHALKRGLKMKILLEVNIGEEESKTGFSADELYESVYEISEMRNIQICGLMAIPPVCNAAEENRKYFSKMNDIFLDIKDKKIDNSNMDILSMGMSNDYSTAISEGANLVRVGTSLFGKRNYNI